MAYAAADGILELDRLTPFRRPVVHRSAAAAHPSTPAHPSTTPAPRPRRNIDLLALAHGFVPSAHGIAPELRRAERTWILLAVTDLFEAWAIGWPPGGKIE